MTSESNVRQLSVGEISSVSGGYSYDTCVVTWTGIGTLGGAILGGGVGAAVGGLAGTWYGEQVCPADGTYQAQAAQ